MLRRAIIVLLATPFVVAGSARGQTRWTVDPIASLAWWQVNPHLNHLWATTCPEEPSWRPGEGRSGGWSIPAGLSAPELGYAAVSDTVHVPLYPRYEVEPLCAEAVHGEVIVPDTVTWRGAHGEIRVRADALVTGENRRDAYAREAVLETRRYPHITFALDSLVDVTRHADTLRGTAVGQFTLHGTTRPVRAAVEAWHEVGGTRVLGKFRIDASDMVKEYGLSSFALGLGVGVKIWHHLFMGLDLLLRPEEAPAQR